MIQPLTDAVAKMSRKTPIGSVLNSAEWMGVPAELRDRAFFSARVESARLLQDMRDFLTNQLSNVREKLDSGETATLDRSTFINQLREKARSLGLTPSDESIRGTIQDITSIPRLGLIYDMNQAQANEYARWKFDQEEGALDLYPAQRLVRIEDRIRKRNWPERWRVAGDEVGWEGAVRKEMVALKTSPIWTELSEFGTPWPPFDWGSGMGIEDVDRDEAIKLNLISEDSQLKPNRTPFNENLQASIEQMDPEIRDTLMRNSGGQLSVQGGQVKWMG